MRIAKLPTGKGKAVSLKFQNFRGRTLIECHEPAALISHLSGGACVPPTAAGPTSTGPITAGSYLRGVVYPDEDAIFEVFDQFGTSNRNVLRVPREQARAKLLDAMICTVQD